MDKKDSKYCSCLYYSANAFARVMTKLADEAFASTGLAPSYAFLLMTVNGKAGVQPKEISEQMQLTPSTVTRLIEKMEQKQYVVRKSVGRAVEVFPTDKSLALQPQLKSAWEELYKKYAATLGDEKASMLTVEIYDAFKKLDA